MGIKHYKPGEHPGKFVGFRVTASWNQEYRQEYFDTFDAETQDDCDPYFKQQHLKAQILDLQWELESLDYQYQQFVTRNHPGTKPHRGLGFQGMTIGFLRAHGDQWEPCFLVNRSKDKADESTRKGRIVIPLKKHLFSDAWKLATNHWVEENEIRPEDIERIRKQPPSPEQFKELRRYMNEVEGCDIPVKSLHPVFAEQREMIRSSRLLEQSAKNGRTLPAHPKQEIDKGILLDVESWFAEEVESYRPGTS